MIFLLACLIHCLFIVSWLTGWLDFLFVEAVRGHGQSADFFGIYQAGENLLRGHSIYDSYDYINEAPLVVPYYYFYRYLPPTAYVAAFGALILKPEPAYWVWLIINELMIALFILTLLKQRRWQVNRRYLAAAICLGFCPIYIEQFIGQFSLTMAMLLWLLWRQDDLSQSKLVKSPVRDDAADDGRHSSSGPAKGILDSAKDIISKWRHYSWRRDTITSWSLPIIWAFSITLKSFSIFLTWPYLIEGKLKRVLLTSAISAALCLPYFAFHWHDLTEFLRLNLSPFSPQLYMGSFGLQNSLRDLCVHLPSSLTSVGWSLAGREIHLTRLIMLAISLSIILAAAWASIRYRHQSHRTALNLLLWVTVFFLVFKSVWEYHYIMMLPGIFAVYLVRGSRFVIAMGICLGLPTLYALAPILFDVTPLDGLDSWPAWFRIVHFSVKTIPTLGLFGWCLYAAAKRTQALSDLSGHA